MAVIAATSSVRLGRIVRSAFGGVVKVFSGS
jgi:hypothetical protein